MTKPNLPPLRAGAEFPFQPVSGAWTHADGTLKQLGRALRVTADKPFRDPDEPVRAIPDAWAQARVFGDAVREPRHSMHRRAIAQWRGLLALFALQSFYRTEYSLEARPLDLSGPHLFERVLSTLPPEISIAGQGGEWRRPWIVLVNPISGAPTPLGLTNPICLVSPGRQSHAILIPGVMWAQGDLADPISLTGNAALPAPQIIALHEWLKKLNEDLRIFTGEIANDVRQALGDFAEACRRELGPGVTLRARVDDSLRLDIPPLYRSLFRSVEIEQVGNPADTSQTMLRLRPGLALGHLKGVVLADPAIAALPGVNPRTTFVWGQVTLAEVIGRPGALAQIRDDAKAHGYWVASADELFTSRAVRLANDPMITSHPPGLQDMLLPIRPLGLLLAGGLRETLSAQSDSQRVVVTLHVALARGDGNDQLLPITRHFAAQPGAGEGLLVNEASWEIYNASLWPNFRSSVWESYFLRFLYNDQFRDNMARPVHGVSADLIAADLERSATPQETIDRVRALNDRATPSAERGRFLRSERRSGQEYEELQTSTVPFEAIAYVEAQGARTSAAAGLVLIDLAPLEPTSGGTTVAIDFGTTNTVACIASVEAPPVTFARRLVVPVKFRKPDVTLSTMHSRRYVYTSFLPPEERSSPSPTVSIGRIPYPNNEKNWLFRNLIYFHSTEQYAQNDEAEELRKFGETARTAKFNLKWSSEPAVAEAASDFLEQFMTMTSAEILAAKYDPRRTRWLFSVPDAMSRTQRERFGQYLNAATAKISSEFAGRDPDDQPLAPLQSEGLSAARYMITAANFNANALNIVLDIGGGTTDVTIWDREEIRWRGSFHLAGQNFFTRLICANPSILREIGLGVWADLFDSAGDATDRVRREDIPYLAEMLFSGAARNETSLNLQRSIEEHWNKRLNGDVGTVLRGTAIVFIAGLAWYIGRVVKHLIATGKLDARIATKPAFALCGRGAGLFKMMHGERRRSDDDTIVTRALRVYDAAAGLTEETVPEVRLTKQAKLEVVRGMLAERSFIDASAAKGARDASTDLPMGLAVTVRDGQAIGAEQLVAGQLLDQQIDTVDLAELDAFLAELEACAGLKVDLFGERRSGARGFIENAARTELELARRDTTSKYAPEPPFIAALRALVAELAAAPDQREGRIGMAFEE